MSASIEEFTAAVLDVVDRIPRGRVMTYGSIATYLQRGGPRGVGGVMAREGRAVPWWRVVRANGTLPAHLMIDAQQHWTRERTATHRGLVDIGRAGWWPGGEGSCDIDISHDFTSRTHHEVPCREVGVDPAG